MTQVPLPEKIAIVERIIVAMRWVRNQPQEPEHQIYLAMKEIANDLRSRLPETKSAAAGRIAGLIDRAKRSKTALGYETGSLRAIAEEVIGRWPTIERALSLFETEEET